MSDMMISSGGLDTDSYVGRAKARAKSVGTSQDVRALMSEALISEAPAPEERPATTPVIPESVVQENLRRVKASARNTLVTINADGTRSYKHDVVNRGDGLIDTGGRVDRGEGTRDSLDMLSKEGKVKVAGLLAKRERDAGGRFSK
jgi:hypothetical protein